MAKLQNILLLSVIQYFFIYKLFSIFAVEKKNQTIKLFIL